MLIGIPTTWEDYQYLTFACLTYFNNWLNLSVENIATVLSVALQDSYEGMKNQLTKLQQQKITCRQRGNGIDKAKTFCKYIEIKMPRESILTAMAIPKQVKNLYHFCNRPLPPLT